MTSVYGAMGWPLVELSELPAYTMDDFVGLLGEPGVLFSVRVTLRDAQYDPRLVHLDVRGRALLSPAHGVYGEVYHILYCVPFEDLLLYVNHRVCGVYARWRLRIGR